MFLRWKVSKGHRYLLLVRGYRHEGKVKQIVVYNFGRQERVNLDEVNRVLARYEGFYYLRHMEPRNASPSGGHNVVPTATALQGAKPS